MVNLEAVIKDCIKLDSKAQTKLYNYYQSDLLTMASNILKDRDLAKDVLQDSFLKIYEKLYTLDNFNPKGIKGWLRLIVRNKCYDKLKASKKTVRLGLEFDAWASIGSLLDYEEESETYLEKIGVSMERVNKSLSKLSPQYYNIFTSFYLDGLTHREIAEKLNISIGASKSSLSKAKKSIIKNL